MSHLDDYPKRTSEHIGESESIQAIRHLFKDPHFLIRKEEENDYGVDLEIEVQLPVNKEGTQPTNIRFHVQLKSSTKDANKDDSYSYPVDRTNLNYLLNSPRSLYVFYSRESSKCYYRWAENVLVEYEKTGANWRKQDSITVRFADLLDMSAVISIHAQMLSEAPRERDLRVNLRRQGIYLYGQFNYDATTGDLTNVDMILDILCKHGLSICANGNAALVLDLIGKVPPSSLNATAKLTKAYASYLMSKCGIAFETLNSYNISDLSNENDRSLHSYLIASLKKSIGLCSQDEFLEELKDIASTYSNSISAIYAKLEKLRYDGILAKNDTPLKEVQSLMTTIKGKGKTWLPLYYQSAIVAFELRYFLLQKQFREQVFSFRIMENMGLAEITLPQRALDAKNLAEDMKKWFQDFEALLKECNTLGINAIVAEGLLVFCSCIIQETLTHDKLVPPDPDLLINRRAQINRTIERLEHASRLFEVTNCMELKARAQLLIVEAFWLQNEKDNALLKASEIKRFAQRNGLVDICNRADRIISGESPIDIFDKLPSIFDNNFFTFE